MWSCCRCKTGQRAIKQMSIRKLPSILTLHVKRFEHRNLHGLGRKLETPLAFPVFRLNMWPFLSACILRRRFKARVLCSLPGMTQSAWQAASAILPYFQRKSSFARMTGPWCFFAITM